MSVSLADQKVETTPSDRLEIRFWSHCHLLIKRWRHPDWKAETPKLRFLKSVSLADQKVETTRPWYLEIRFLKSLSLADQKVETPWLKGRDTQTYVFEVSVTCWSKGGDTLIERQRHPNLGFWSQCHLLMTPDQKTPKGFWRHSWSKGGDM